MAKIKWIMFGRYRMVSEDTSIRYEISKTFLGDDFKVMGGIALLGIYDTLFQAIEACEMFENRKDNFSGECEKHCKNKIAADILREINEYAHNLPGGRGGNNPRVSWTGDAASYNDYLKGYEDMRDEMQKIINKVFIDKI